VRALRDVAELIDRLSAIHVAAPGPLCEINMQQMGGAVARVAASSASTGRAHVDFLGDPDAARTSYGETA
jgi:hypothetical protein